MDCQTTQSRLISFHFGALTDEARGAVEAHLQSCAVCLQSYFLVKRSIEEGSRSHEAPLKRREWLDAEARGNAPEPPPRSRRGQALLAGAIGGVVAAVLLAGGLVVARGYFANEPATAVSQRAGREPSSTPGCRLRTEPAPVEVGI